MVSLFQKFVAGADSFGQLSSGISNSIISGIVYWLIVSIVMGILFIITGLLIIGTGYQVGGENLPEILLGYYQHHGGDNEYSYHNLFRKMDKINYSDKPHYVATSGTCGLYRNPMLCENWREKRGYF